MLNSANGSSTAVITQEQLARAFENAIFNTGLLDAITDSKNIYLACLGAGRAYGYVCAPSLMQHVIEKVADKTSDMNAYVVNRNLIYDGLTKIGYECVKPEGAFYLFVKSLEKDAYKFMERAKEYNIIVVPSDNFGIEGYVRLAYCVSKDTISNSLPAFKKLFDSYK
jgi:aspartate aminotransferase